MKRAIALVLGLLAFFTSAASANTCFSTGPLDNRGERGDEVSDQARVIALNLSPSGSVTATVVAFSLNAPGTFGTKLAVFGPVDFVVKPKESGAVTFDIGGAFEIQVKLDGPAKDETLLGVFGAEGINMPREQGDLNPSHRLVHTELAKISCDLFGDP